MVVFHSYVSLPEGNQHSPTNQHRPTTNLPGGSSRTATWTSESRMSRNGSDDARRVLGGPGSQRFNAGGGERDEEKKMCVENPLTFWHILTLKIKLNENQEKWWKSIQKVDCDLFEHGFVGNGTFANWIIRHIQSMNLCWIVLLLLVYYCMSYFGV